MARHILCLSAILLFFSTCQGNINETIARQTISVGSLNAYYVYTRDNPREPVQVQPTAAGASGIRIMREKTVILVHDLGGQYLSSLNPTVKNALLTAEDVSVIVVDWSLVASLTYEFAVSSVPELGAGIANLVRFMVSARRITLNNLHLVGFGLGAHIVAHTARALTTGRVARITGLDPSGELWTSTSGRLGMDDAEYVEVIHTDSGGNGISESLGHVDFFPNGGINQIGCSIIDNDCHHDRSWEFFAASLTHGSLQGNLCRADTAPSDANCRGYSLEMGNNALIKYGEGSFYLDTTDKYPYTSESNCVVCE